MTTNPTNPASSEPHPASPQPYPTESQPSPLSLPGVLFAVYGVVLIAVVIFKLPFRMVSLGDSVRAINLVPLSGSFDIQGRLAWEEIVYNSAVFVPFGVYVSVLARWSAAKRIAVAAGLSIIFEVSQFAFGIGVLDITDVISNTAGAAVGLSLHTAARQTLGAKAARIGNGIGLALTVVALAGFAYLWHHNNIIMGPPP
ncbi:MAG: VanZ family protein [Bifidobacteriaceae bacterium]|nr:VanZ family protein [Bifidobacteriaceae bacterium]